MSTLRQSRNFWLPWVTTIFLAWASDAGAQTNYKVTDLGTLGNDNMSCAMTLTSRRRRLYRGSCQLETMVALNVAAPEQMVWKTDIGYPLPVP